MAKGKKAPRGPLSMADRDGWIWHDGKLVEWRSATTHVLTHSLHYGLAVFEGVRAYKTQVGTAIYRLKEHTDRLFNSAHIYMMKIPYSREVIMEAQKEVVRANRLELVATSRRGAPNVSTAAPSSRFSASRYFSSIAFNSPAARPIMPAGISSVKQACDRGAHYRHAYGGLQCAGRRTVAWQPSYRRRIAHQRATLSRLISDAAT